MKIKNIISYISIFVLTVTFVSCEDFLDIEPQQSIDAEHVYEDHNGVVNALHGAYERIAGAHHYAGTSIFQSDLLANSGELNWIGTFIGYRQMDWKSLDPNDDNVRLKWRRSYQAIDIANNVLDNLDKVNEDDRYWVEGEAKFIRGIIYLELVRFYANPYVEGDDNTHDGVPLVLEPTPLTGLTEKHYPERASVGDVYNAILNDLTDSKDLLADFVSAGSNNGKATGSAAAAFLSRVYLDMEQWENAANEADYVIKNFGGYNALNSTPREAYNNDEYTSEDVFMIKQNTTSNAGQANQGIGTFFASLDGYGRGDVHIDDSHFDIFEEDDLRTIITDDPGIVTIDDVPGMYYYGVGTDPDNIMSSKWGKYYANINVIRLAEVILTRAEANFRNSSSIGADPVEDINAIRNRAGLTENLDAADITLNEIRDERYRELCFEGHRLHDVRRFREDVTIPSGDLEGEVLQWDSGKLVLPIPQREIDVNENLNQNDEY